MEKAHTISEFNPEDKTAVCSVCGPTIPKIRMVTTKTLGARQRLECKEKVNTDNRRWKKDNHIKVKVRNDIRRYAQYSITEDIYIGMLDEQDNKCKICLKKFGEKNVPQIDHCHETLTVRGLLCKPCNIGLGHFRDNEDVLQKAIDYLRGSK